MYSANLADLSHSVANGKRIRQGLRSSLNDLSGQTIDENLSRSNIRAKIENLLQLRGVQTYISSPDALQLAVSHETVYSRDN